MSKSLISWSNSLSYMIVDLVLWWPFPAAVLPVIVDCASLFSDVSESIEVCADEGAVEAELPFTAGTNGTPLPLLLSEPLEPA